MSSFIRDLSVDPRARQARIQQGFEEAAQAPPFRPSAIYQNIAVTGPYTSATPIATNGGSYTVPSTGLYHVSYSVDAECATSGFIASFQFLGGGAISQSIGNATAGARIPLNGVWAGKVNAGEVLSVRMSSPGGATSMIIQGGTFVIMRVA